MQKDINVATDTSNVATASNKSGIKNDNVLLNVPLKINVELSDRQQVILSILRDNVPLEVPLNTTILSQKLHVAHKTSKGSWKSCRNWESFRARVEENLDTGY